MRTRIEKHWFKENHFITEADLTSESREGGREGCRGEGTVGPGQSGLAVAAGQTSRQTEKEVEEEEDDDDDDEKRVGCRKSVSKVAAEL